MTEREPLADPYWTEDRLLGEARLPEGPSLVRLRLHQAEEAIPDRPSLVPLAHPNGSRLYVHAQPYILEPDIALTIDLQPAAPGPGVLGTVVDAAWEGMRHIAIGQAQAWFYPADRLLMLWECYLRDPWRQADPLDDPALGALWHGFEAELWRRFPTIERLATPAWDAIYPRPAWQAFLIQQRHAPATAAVFRKVVSSHPS